MMRTLPIPYTHRSPQEARYWPADHHPDLDEERVELHPQADRPYEVYSATGRVLDRFADKWAAVNAMERWPQAAFIVHGARVVARKDGAA